MVDPESWVSYRFLDLIAWFHKSTTPKSKVNSHMTLETSLFNMSRLVNDSRPGYELYHPDLWTSQGYPHDAFAV